ncbi:MAG: AEC family transporter [Chloroflexota bacterium]
MLNTILNVIAPIFLIMAVGFIYGRRYQPDPKIISSLIINVFSPFLVIEGFMNVVIPAGELAQIGLIVVLVALTLTAIGSGVTRVMGVDGRTASAMLLSMVLINAANYGIPFNEFAFGEAAGQIAVVYYAMSVIVINTLGVYLASRGTAASAWSAIGNIFRVPLLYATVIGFGSNLAGVTMNDLPLALERVIDVLSDAAVPAMLVLLGVQLAGLRVRHMRLAPVLASTATTLLVAPAVALLWTLVLGMNGLPQTVGIVQHAMPTAVIAAALATEFDADAELVTGVLLLSTGGSVLTLSLLVQSLPA